ncbi:unnamed protein product, partial [Prunus brigantina]
MSDLLKTNNLSSPSTFAELVNHIRQANDLDTVSIFAAKTIWNSSVVAPSSAQLSDSSTADLASRKDALFCLECKNADISLSYDKLLARRSAHHKSAKKFKFEATIDVYKLGYLHCTNGTAPFYAIEDGNIEAL